MKTNGSPSSVITNIGNSIRFPSCQEWGGLVIVSTDFKLSSLEVMIPCPGQEGKIEFSNMTEWILHPCFDFCCYCCCCCFCYLPMDACYVGGPLVEGTCDDKDGEL
uniref:(northern house mosquito) hypothetical protein n=1 Tax=Culex pipiens TaxID=7175 RepID=A0A8D8JVE3_CULPI